MNLSEDQVDQVSRLIKRLGVQNRQTGDDLLDHLCCMIEARLSGGSFEKALDEVVKEFPASEWKQMEVETQIVIDQNQIKMMNNTLRTAGILSASLIFFGAFFKAMHWPGANLLFLSGMVIMAAVFLPVFFIVRYRSSGEENRNITLSILAAGCGILLCAGMLFKFLHWPFATLLLNSAIALLLLAYIPVYVLSVYRKSLNRTSALANVILMVAAGSTLFLANSRGPSRVMLEQYQSEALRQGALVKKQTDINAGLIEGIQDQNLMAVHKEISGLIDHIERIKAEMISYGSNGSQEAVTSWEKSSGVNFVWLESASNKETDFAGHCEKLRAHESLKDLPLAATEYFADLPLSLAVQRLTNYQILLGQYENQKILSAKLQVQSSDTSGVEKEKKL